MCFATAFHINPKGVGTFGGGLISIWNNLAETVGNSRYFILPVFNGESEGNGLFFAFIGLVTFAFTYLLFRKEKMLPLLIFCGLFFTILIICGVYPSAFAIGVLLLGLGCGYIFSKNASIGFGKSLAVMTIVLLLTLVVVNIPISIFQPSGPAAISSLRDHIAATAKDIYYGENPLKEGKLSEEKRADRQGTALEITMAQPHSTYLRGFIGDRIVGDKWESLDPSTYYQSKDLMYQLKEVGFNGMGQSGLAEKLISGTDDLKDIKSDEKEKIQVEVKKANKYYAYIPYGFEGNISNGKEWGGSFFTPKNMKRLSSYSYYESSNPAEKWTDTAGAIFTDSNDKSKKDQQVISQYLGAESYYNSFIYENYRYVSQSDREILAEYLGTPGDMAKGHRNYKDAIEKVKTFMKDNFVYTEDRGEVDKKISPLKEFFESRKGYDVQYATASTLMFRYYGIPARYVEGYLVTIEDEEKMKVGEPYSLPLSRAHAWCEIYIDGVGFIPVETCPKYEGVMRETDMSVGIANDILKNRQEQINQGGLSQQQIEGGNEDVLRKTNIYLIVSVILALLFLLTTFIFLGKKIFIHIKEDLRRKKLFEKAEPKKAVSAIYGYMENQGYHIDCQVREKGNKAAYSPYKVQEEDRAFMLKKLKEAKKEKKGKHECKVNFKKWKKNFSDSSMSNNFNSIRNKLRKNRS